MVRIINFQHAQAQSDVDDIIDGFDGVDKPTTLATAVNDAYRLAQQHRASKGIDDDMYYSVCAFEGRYTEADKARLGITEDNDIFAPVTRTKCIALMSWLHDIFSSAEEHPWTIEPTPVPSLPESLQSQIEAQLIAELQAAQGEGLDITPEMLEERAEEMMSLQFENMKKVAQRAIDRLDKKLADLLIEGGWRDALAQVIHDLAIYPNAFVRGPFQNTAPRLVWDGSTIKAVDATVLHVERISPFDVFPSPDSTTPHDGAYICERMFLTADALSELAKLPGAMELGVFPGNIERLLEQHSTGYRYHFSSAEEENPTEEQSEETDESRRYEVVVYYGRMRREAIRDFFAGREGTYDHIAAADVVEVECWVCDQHVIRLVQNADGILQRPIYSVPFLERPGEFWGVSLPMILRDIQRVANSCLRSLVYNMSFSSGPIGEYDIDRLSNEENIEQIQPYRMYAIENDVRLNQVAATPALRFHSIDSHARELLAVYDRFLKEADDASGIPAYVIGAPQVAGAGRTLGGLALLMGNAAKGIKRIVGNMDKRLIEPLVRQAYAILMKHDSDVSIKADAQVHARGASGLLQRELQQARAVEVLQLLTPYVQAGVVPASAIQVLLRHIVRSLGFSPDELIPDPGRQEDIARYTQIQTPNVQASPEALNQLVQALQGFGPNGAPPQPTLDGRQELPPEPGEEDKLPPA